MKSVKPNSLFSTRSLLICAAFLSTACGPRGESKSIDEILTSARTAYVDISSRVNNTLSPNVKTQIESVTASLDQIAALSNGGDLKQSIDKIDLSLSSIIENGGYTLRPALNELINQYRELESKAALSAGAPELKLIAARTYQALAVELATTKFGVK